MNFGMTNDINVYNAAIAYREAVIADGWVPKRDDGENYTKSGYSIMILSRTDVGRFKYQASVHLWCPQGIAINPPNEYSWDKIVLGLRVCGKCKAEDVDTFRVGFANRVCKSCLPSERTRLEYRGWCD